MGLWRNRVFRFAISVLIIGFVVIGVCSFFGVNLSKAYAKAQPQVTDKPKAVLILVNGTTLEDYSAEITPNIYDLMQQGSVALMNTRPGGVRNSPNAYATIGAGKHVVSSGYAGDAFNTAATLDEIEGLSAGASYIARTGMKPPAEGVVTLGISQIIIANEREDILDGPGMLGDSLSAAGRKTAVLGNGDVHDEFNRDVVTIAMDRWGRVDYGDVSRNLLAYVPQSPIGYHTDYEVLFDKFQDVYDKADFIVIETGDTYRIEEISDSVFPEIMSGEKRSALKRADAFVGKVLKAIAQDNTLLIITSPHPSKAALKNNNYMCPIVVYQEGLNAGFLTSGTTRRPGVVANTDIAPTVLSHLGLPIPAGLEGRVLETISSGNFFVHGQKVDKDGVNLAALSKMNDNMIFVYKARPVLVKGYVGLQIVVMVVVISFMILWPHLLRFLRPGLLWLMAVPLSLLVIGAVGFVSLPVYTFLAIVIAALVVMGAYILWGKRDVDLFIIIGLATAIAVLGDVLVGAPLIKNSTLGYDAMSGSRYYGIGNEFMGVVIGAAIIAISSIWEKYYEHRTKLVEIFSVAIFVITIVIMGAPQLGTNGGGTIAAVVAFVFTYLQLKDVKVGLKQLVAIGGGVALVILAMAVFDMNRAVEAQSHLGRFAGNITSNGWPVIVEMFSRKIQMNIKLMRYTIWSRVFLVMLAALMISFYRPAGLMQKVRSSYPYIFKGLLGILVGAAVALAVNDSGIVAAATMMIFGMAPLIYLMGKEREKVKHR